MISSLLKDWVGGEGKREREEESANLAVVIGMQLVERAQRGLTEIASYATNY